MTTVRINTVKYILDNIVNIDDKAIDKLYDKMKLPDKTKKIVE
jgi:hypothetical protein